MIASAWLDGTHRKPLVTTRISNPRDLTIDMQTHDVFWVDSREDAIFSVSYKGGNRRVIRGSLPNPKGLAILKGDVYWVDRNMKKIFKASKLPDQVAVPEVLKSGLEDLRDISILDIQNQPRSQNNPCSRLGNGGCKQLCFSLPDDNLNFKCDCATGVLATDKVSCITASEYIVYSTRSEIRSEIIPINITSQQPQPPFKPVVNMSNVVGIEFDYRDSKLLFTQIRPDPVIGWMDAKNPSINYTTILDKKNGINPEGLAYDWVHKKIYETVIAKSSKFE